MTGIKNRISKAACSLLVILSAIPAMPAHADTLIDNIEGIALDKDGQEIRFGALWIDDDGKIKQVIERTDVRPASVDRIVDGKGHYVLPGFIDSHAHIMGIGFGALTLDLSGTTSLEDAQKRIAEYAAQYPGRPWILGRGWNQEQWGLGRFPTAADLDAVVADRPVWLSRIDGHAGWANSAAIAAAGVDVDTPAPDGGRIEKIPGSEVPQGVFVDNAVQLIQEHAPKPTPADRDLALFKAQDILLQHGITAIADMGTAIADWQAFRRAGDNGSLRMRIIAYAAGTQNMELIGGPGPTSWLYEDRLRLNGVKLYLDGALGSRGAWLKRPYADDPDNTGLPLVSPINLRNQMSRAALDKFQIAVHAIGDAANIEVLRAISELSLTYQGDRRWRIEHAQILDPSDIDKFSEHGIIASMQPVHQTSDRLMAEERLGTGRLKGAYAWRTIKDTGAPLVYGSDAPVESPDVFAGFAAAISRTDANGEPFGGWYPSEVVSRTETLEAFTSAGAFAMFAEGRFGRLAKGEYADFIMVDRDIMLSRPEDIRTTRVLQTWVGGKQMFDINSE